MRCPRCGKSEACDKAYCPLRSKESAVNHFKTNIIDNSFEGSAPTVFVGEYGYPKVNVGIMSPTELDKNAWLFDAQRFWGKNEFEIDKVIALRSELVNSRFNTDIRHTDKLLELSQEVGMASKPVDIEVDLKEKMKFNVNFSNMMAPTGPNANLQKVELTSNPKIDTKVDKVVSDIDFKANEAMNTLYDKGYEESFLTKLLSIGNIGVKKDRRLVPTKWSITAVDDNVGKNIIKELRDFPESDCLAFFNSYLGNYYLILLFDDVWGFELFEGMLKKDPNNITFSTDYELFKGRTKYAENCVGGYYAARLPIIEKLKQMKRQSSVFVLRFISEEYYTPLGVWVVREAVRKTINSPPIQFADRDLMIEFSKKLIKKKFGYELANVLDRSVLVKHIKHQTKLNKFL